MTLAALAQALPGDFVLTLVDVGSAGGVQARWRSLSSVVSAILFDPREDAPTGGFGRGAVRVYPVALGRAPGPATLNVLALPNMSSLLQPNHALLSTFRKKGAHARIVDTATLDLEPLDGIGERDGFAADVIKVDTQGSELEVLNGATGQLAGAVLVEVEVSFIERYLGQPLFADIDACMRAAGFDLVELHRLKRYRALNSLGVGNVGLGGGQRAGQLAYGDAIYLRRDLGTPHQRLAAIVALCAYGKPDLAARIFDAGGIDERVGKAIRGLGQARLGWRFRHAVLDWLSRKS